MVYRLACERPELVEGVAAIVPFGTQVRNDLATWTRRDGCPAEPAVSRLPDVDPADGTQTRVDLYEPCAAGTAVALYTIEGGRHAWPGGEKVFGFRKHGNTARDFDAGHAIWEFFKQHPRH